MAIDFQIKDPLGLVSVKQFDIQPGLPDQVTIREINIVESLLNPAAQISATIQSDIYNPSGKDFDKHKNKDISFTLERKTFQNGREIIDDTMKVKAKVYRLDQRHFMPVNVGNVEEMTFHAIDETVLKDAQTLISKSWKCTKPSEIVKNTLQQLGAQNTKIGEGSPARDYIAENIHPFQIIAQQAQVAVDGNDPSFIHFMTIDPQSGEGVHHFESLKSLTSKNASENTFFYGDSVWTGGGGYQSKFVALNFSFPCDFDYLSDLLNGLDENGKDKNTGFTVNPASKLFEGIASGGGFGSGFGLGGFNYKQGLSNKATAEQQNSCNMDVETHLIKRQARMGLLEKDKIALRITIPWNSKLHAGSLISLQWKNKFEKNQDVYGHGEFLVSSMMHTIKFGGFATTTLDCVSKTVGQGIAG